MRDVAEPTSIREYLFQDQVECDALLHRVVAPVRGFDEAAFATGRDRTLAIRVEPSERSQARYHIGSQLDIDAFLRTLLDLRRGTFNPD